MFMIFFIIGINCSHYLGGGIISPPSSKIGVEKAVDLGPDFTKQMLNLKHPAVRTPGYLTTADHPSLGPVIYPSNTGLGGVYHHFVPAEEYEHLMPDDEEPDAEDEDYDHHYQDQIPYSHEYEYGGLGMGPGSSHLQHNISIANQQANDPGAYEAATGLNNIGLEVALRRGMNGIIGLAGQAGLEGGMGQGDISNTMRMNGIQDTAMKNMDMISNQPSHIKDPNFVKFLGLDKSNNTIGGLLGAASLTGNGGITGAAGLGKIIGNQPGIGPNTGAIMGIATSEGINGPITMAPEDIGNEIKESLGATPKIASAAKAGLSIGTRAAMEAGIMDPKAAQTLAGLAEGMATGNVLDEQNAAMKAMGVEGAATSVSGYMGIPDAANHGSLASYLGIGPSGEAAKVGALGKGVKGADDVNLAIKQNQIKMILDLNRRNHKEKEDIIENTLKINSLKKDLNELP